MIEALSVLLREALNVLVLRHGGGWWMCSWLVGCLVSV
jgi:hypothetical protein